MYNSSKLVKGIGTKGMTYPTWDGKKILKEYYKNPEATAEAF